MFKIIILIFTVSIYAQAELWLSYDGVNFEPTTEESLGKRAIKSHNTNTYCGGFIVMERPEHILNKSLDQFFNLQNYTINREAVVKDALSRVQERRLYKFIEKFSSYKTRYYKSSDGVRAAKDLAKNWSEITSTRSDINVSLYKHRKWPQDSVVLEIKGRTNQNIIIGGHLDSINTNDEGVHSHAPGADDNASGISVLTETLRVLVESNYQPENNIIFIAYAAEEVGLRGSLEIAQKYAKENQLIKGVLQIDGTNYNGSSKKIVLINDHTNSKQNKFLGNLIDRYVNVSWAYDTCGYACSDHYAWTYNGFIASFPAEAYVKEENPFIHTENDTVEVMNNRADHAVYFTKLSLAYLIELDK